jgi:hypothetical protein
MAGGNKVIQRATISPDRMKATGRVNGPSSISRLPTISIIPTKPSRDSSRFLSITLMALRWTA